MRAADALAPAVATEAIDALVAHDQAARLAALEDEFA